jgi:hypothetical protein
MRKNGIKSSGEILSDFFDSVPHGKYFWLRNEIKKRCGITKDVLRNWEVCVTAIPKLAKEKIEQIAAEIEGVPEKHLFPELHTNN